MKGRVLIAEDEPSLRRCMAEFLAAQNFDVQSFDCAASAIAALDRGEFDVVITDMRLETEEAGYDIVRAARAKRYEPEIVVFTARQIAAAEWRGRGVKKLFSKGEIEISDLSKAIHRIFDERMRCRAPLSTSLN